MTFEKRRSNETTAVYLGRVLEEYLGLPEMAKRAREGHFDDYFCPPEVDDGFNIQRLVNELTERKKGLVIGSPQYRRINEVITDAIEGEFDGTLDESDHWAKSKDGQETMRQLFPPRKRV